MNNEPVAWMIKTLDGKRLMLYGKEQPPKFESEVQYIPLYTHPAKTLTDEEIKSVMALDECWIGEDCSMPNMIAFARAILRKAQEK